MLSRGACTIVVIMAISVSQKGVDIAGWGDDVQGGQLVNCGCIMSAEVCY